MVYEFFRVGGLIDFIVLIFLIMMFFFVWVVFFEILSCF